jgi:MFS family permease
MSVFSANKAVDDWASPVILAIRAFNPLAWTVAVLAAVVSLVVIGVPTRIIDNPLFIRMTPVRTQDYVFWAITAALTGLIAGTFVAGRAIRKEGRVLSGGILSYLAVGCPVCNKLVVLLIGTSGALTFFAPAQLFIGIASVALLASTLAVRSRSLVRACPLVQPPSA